ncbi:hypothetical protein EON63_14850 [archaeon]|nr:MAG: hypothetical protein EON63_14850 [archaeon]
MYGMGVWYGCVCVWYVCVWLMCVRLKFVCAYMVCMFITIQTNILTIYIHTHTHREAGYKLCASQVPSSCWQLVLDEVLVVTEGDLDMTAEAADLFNRDKKLQVDATCA